MNNSLEFLRKPEGVRDLLPEAAYLKRKIEEKVLKTFSDWGYNEVLTPSLEFASIFSDKNMKTDLKDQLYRFTGDKGQTLALRPDLTLPMARLVCTQLKNEPLPLRLAYTGNVFRYITPKMGKQRELYQAGVELLGSDSSLADAELIALVVASLQSAGLKDLKICIGHVGLLHQLLVSLKFNKEEIGIIKNYFNSKDFVSLENYIDTIEVEKDDKSKVIKFATLKGGLEALEEVKKMLPADTSKNEVVERLQKIINLLEKYGVKDKVLFDFGLVRGLNYYSGIVFEGYTGNIGFPICGGGRYDQLLEHFNNPMPATGFAISINNLLLAMQRSKMGFSNDSAAFVAFSQEGQDKALEYVIESRSDGKRIEMTLKSSSQAEGKELANKKNASSYLYFDEKGLSHQENMTEIKQKWNEPCNGIIHTGKL